PRHYLLLVGSNAEMRAGSGAFLSVGVLDTAAGSFELKPTTASGDLLLQKGVPITDADLAARWGWLEPNREWRNLGVSPRFDVTAPLAARMWEARGGGPVDGVLALDPAALRALLRAVGAVDVGGTRIDAEHVEDQVLHRQYLDFPADADLGARREQLGAIAGASVTALATRDWDPSVLARGLGEAARGRHVLAWSARPEEEEGWIAAGIDGSMTPDSLLVGVLNRGGNKLDRFLDVAADLDIRGRGSGQEAVLRLRLHNRAPQGEPAYVVGPAPGSGAGEGVYLGILAVSLPGDARQGRIDGETSLAVVGADGPSRVVATSVSIPRGGDRVLTVRFGLPGGRHSLRVEPSARLPAISWTDGSRRWTDGSAHTIRW
ncbi:MAG: DUF4012 domain-containing protein, partial [Acidimicrobiales bacterium]